MTAQQDTEQNLIINECMRMVYDKDYPKEFGFTRHTKKHEKYTKIREFRTFWFIKCFGLSKSEAIEAFINNEKTRPEEVRQAVVADNTETLS